MKNAKFPLPKKYWIYVFLAAVFAVLLFVNIFVTNGLTGEKEFWDFIAKDWFYFAAFLLTEIIIGFLMFFFSVQAGKMANNNQRQITKYYEQFRYSGIKPGDYTYIWFDYSGDERALILKDEDAFRLYIEEFDKKSEEWRAVNAVSIYSSMDEIRKALFYEFDFFCEENAEMDEHGDEVFKENRG